MLTPIMQHDGILLHLHNKQYCKWKKASTFLLHVSSGSSKGMINPDAVYAIAVTKFIR